jgi:hypothetical protein
LAGQFKVILISSFLLVLVFLYSDTFPFPFVPKQFICSSALATPEGKLYPRKCFSVRIVSMDELFCVLAEQEGIVFSDIFALFSYWAYSSWGSSFSRPSQNARSFTEVPIPGSKCANRSLPCTAAESSSTDVSGKFSFDTALPSAERSDSSDASGFPSKRLRNRAVQLRRRVVTYQRRECDLLG